MWHHYKKGKCHVFPVVAPKARMKWVSRLQFILWDIISFIRCILLLSLSFVLFLVFFCYLLSSSHYFTLSFFSAQWNYSFHTVCNLDMAYELCIFLSPSISIAHYYSLQSLLLLTRFPSLFSTTKHQSEKMWWDKFVVCLHSRSSLSPVYFSFDCPPLGLEYAE